MVAYLFMGLKGIFLCIVKCSVKLLLYSAIVGRQGAVSCAVALEHERSFAKDFSNRLARFHCSSDLK